MQQRRRKTSYSRRCLHLLLFASAGLCSEIGAQSPSPAPSTNSTPTLLKAPRIQDTPPEFRPATTLTPSAPALQATAPSEIALQPPINSTLEVRVARRPWLLEKLTGPKRDPAVKMNPPRPPAPIPDPPSAARLAPNRSDLGGWVRRENLAQKPGYADVELRSETVKRQPTGAESDSPVADLPVAELPTARPPVADLPVNDVTEPDVTTSDVPVASSPAGSDAATVQEVPAEVASAEDRDSVDLEPSVSAERDAELDLVDPVPLADAMPEPESSAVVDDEPESENEPDVDDDPLGGLEEVVVRDLRAESSAEGSVYDLEPETESLDPIAPPEDSILSTVNLDQLQLDYTGFPQTPIRLSSSVYRMQNTMRQCLRYYYSKPEIANERSNWGMLHAMMVFGADTKLRVGNRSYSSIAWIAGNNACRGQKLLVEQEGRITAKSGVGLQGHQAQFLAILSLCGVPADYALYAGDGQFTVTDLIESEMLACKSGEELTFTLIGLAHYLDTEAVWTDARGETWDFQRLIREELSQPIVGAACGGTHRLMGFAHALRKRRAEGRPITGQWKRAELYTRDYVSYAYRLQNRDGSMTTDWFEGREDNGDLDRKIQTTGHIVEWLLTVTPDSKLQDRRLVSAVRYLLNAMYGERTREWRIGPKGHALRSLAMYYERVYQNGPAWQSRSMAQSRTAPRR